MIRCDNSGIISGGSPSVGESSIYVEEETFAIAAEFFTASLAVGKSAGVYYMCLIYGLHVYNFIIEPLLNGYLNRSHRRHQLEAKMAVVNSGKDFIVATK